MEQVDKFLTMGVNVILFCMAVSLLLLGSENFNSSIRLLKASVFRQNVIREQELWDTSANNRKLTATKGEIIGSLLDGMEVTLIIDGTACTKDIFQPEDFDYTIIKEGVYLKEYRLDDNGYITEIIYTHMEE
ncbi:hypothetical protein R2R35_20295 [Anaerocolumna sp. AGMB13020]|uniref:hypothetical protein n=1 Tax=Anaerocolumna sp. AGMB13020 TaxID=3081750 RepID=UPI002952D035|nr:hypothetical protein [Anaerocolumna sp. AGMB13020]WOO36115.1 hypothetical protein R2R35_20295 [Anaerocolumna sp. AGMB13020]